MKYIRQVYDKKIIEKAIHDYRNTDLSSDAVAQKYNIYRGAIFYHGKNQQQGGAMEKSKSNQSREIISKEEYFNRRKKISSANIK
jgi:hypothetical protein